MVDVCTHGPSSDLCHFIHIEQATEHLSFISMSTTTGTFCGAFCCMSIVLANEIEGGACPFAYKHDKSDT